MKLSFRQGIVQRQEPTFLQVGVNYVDLIVNDTPTILTFASTNKNYLVIEQLTVLNAWGPIVPGVDQWLYWDINVLTGQRTFGITLIPPVVSTTAPVGPSNGQMWFNPATATMSVRQTGKWVPKIRVFACKLSNGVIPVSMSFSPTFTGTQVGLIGENVAGQILFDNAIGQPIVNSAGQFVTTEDELAIQSIQISDVKFASLVIRGQAQQPLAAYSIVRWTNYDLINYANDFTASLQPFGLIESDVNTGEVVNVITTGAVANQFWNFSIAGAGIGDLVRFPTALAVNAPLYCDPTGQLTSVKPNPGSLPVAIVVDQQTILVGVPAASLAVGGGGGGSIGKATTSTYGIVKISIPPTVPGDPIALGANDPRLVFLNGVTSDIQDQLDNTVKLTGDQTVAGQKTFTDGITISNALTINTDPGTPGQVLISAGPGVAPVWGAVAGIGTVTSVGLAAPSHFSVSGSPVTSAGTLTLSWNTQVANTIFAGPASGGSNPPAFRTLVDADLPLVANIGTGTFLKFTRDGYGRVTGTTPVVASDITALVGVSGTVTSVNASGGSTGMTFTGGPITTSGTLTLSGTLGIANGGTGQTTATAAINALLPTQAGNAGFYLTTNGTNISWAAVPPGYTDEEAQDAVGTILTDTASIDFTYNDGVPSITANVIPGGVNHNLLLNYVANQHIDHSTVSILNGTGITGGGDLTTSRTLSVVANTTVQKIEVTKNSGSVVGTRKQLNFIEGSNVTLTVADDGVNDQVDITINASGGGTPGGSNTQIQFNNSGTFDGDSHLTWDDTTQRLTVGVTGAGQGRFIIYGNEFGDFYTPDGEMRPHVVAGSNFRLFFGVPGSGTERFRVTSTGAVAFNTSFGTSGQVLTSNGSGTAPTWVDASSLTTVIEPTNQIVYGTGTGVDSEASLTWNPSTDVLTIGGNLTFSGTGRRITGDFTNATLTNRTIFQTSTTNGNTDFTMMPNGTGNTSALLALNSSTPTNVGYISTGINNTNAFILSGRTGTGTALPLIIQTGSTLTTAVTIDTSQNTTLGGNLTFSGIGRRITGDFTNATASNRVLFQTSTTNGNTSVNVITNGTGNVGSVGVCNGSDINNAASVQIICGTTGINGVNSFKRGTGTTRQIDLAIDGAAKFSVGTGGDWLIGGTLAGTVGQVLTSGGAGAPPTWSTVSVSPGGSNTQIQFNNSGAFGGDADFTWDTTNNIFSVVGTRNQSFGNFSTAGDALVQDYVLRILTTNNTPTAMLVNGNPLTLPNDATWRFEALIVARKVSPSGEHAAFKLTGCIIRDTGAATTAIIGTVAKVIDAQSSGATSWDVSAVANTTNGSLDIEVTGQTAVNIRWVGFIKITQAQ